MRTDGETRLRSGLQVYGPGGERIGTVAEISEKYFVVARGGPFTNDLLVPAAAIGAVAEDRAVLKVTGLQLEENSSVSPTRQAGAVNRSRRNVESAPTAAATHGDQ